VDAGRVELRRERRGPEGERIKANRLLTLAIAGAVLTLLLYGVFVRTHLGQRIDDAALEGRASLTAEQIHDADELLATVDLASIVILGGAVVLIPLLRGRFLLALAAVAVLAGANLTTQVLKEVLPRPILLPEPEEIILQNSLPSGHTTVAASIAVAALLVVPRRFRGPVAVVGVLYAAAVGVATLAAGWHRPSDAVAAYAVVVSWAAAAAWILVLERGPGKRQGAATPLASPLLVVAGGGLCALTFLGLAGALAARRLGRLDAVNLGRAYATASVAIVGAALLLVGLLLVALRQVTLDARPSAPVGSPTP